MNKLTSPHYECPKCADQVSPIHTYILGPQPLGFYRCINCLEYCGKVENCSVQQTIMSNKEDRHCPYCQKALDNISVADDWSDYWRCSDCKVSYEEITRGPNKPPSKSSTMYCEINGKTYCLHQFLSDNYSRIELIPKNLDDTIIIVADFMFLFPDVTPQNIAQKLPIYILFS